ncbi:hypothetical protein [Tetragenococcus solitarius]|uniref:Uncharacterized protein n=1 Tax=Tetragenococcus solitarius TaxID=71453 RepID=A0ABN3YA82_9ENTE|nr:hypothetical protein [Tetragenococcus solitarius]
MKKKGIYLTLAASTLFVSLYRLHTGIHVKKSYIRRELIPKRSKGTYVPHS